MFEQMKADDLGMLLMMGGIFVGGPLIAITAIVSEQWRKARQRQLDHELKAELIAQGRSADEIERILSATSSPGGRRRLAASRGAQEVHA
jgi:Tfp pilus assembly protein PilN